jgi:hypothetical protein
LRVQVPFTGAVIVTVRATIGPVGAPPPGASLAAPGVLLSTVTQTPGLSAERVVELVCVMVVVPV